MTRLYLDLETKNLEDLELRGLDNYSKSLSCAPLMMSFAFDDDPVDLWEPHVSEFPKECLRALKSDVELVAWHSTFERYIFGNCPNFLQIRIPPERFLDPMTWARHLSLPGSLEECGAALGLTEDQAKIADGKRLIRRFCEPFRLGGEMTLFRRTEPEFHGPDDSPEDWKLFGEYCKRDTEAERTILKKMEPFPLSELEHKIWCLDQRINDAGLPVNLEFVDAALFLAEKAKAELMEVQRAKTGLENPNSRPQMLEWAQKFGYPYNSLEKKTVSVALADMTNRMTPLCREVLKTRQEASKTSYTKFQRIKELVSSDGRVRNQYMFMGASRTGRWSSSGGMQAQNFPRPTKDVESRYQTAVDLVLNRDYEGIKKEFGSVMDCIASVTRSSIWAM